MSMDKLVKDLSGIISESNSKKTKAYDTTAEVVRIEGDTVWVHIPGGVDETPVKRTMSANVGDNVQVRVSGGTAWLQGNATSPPTDDTKANAAYSVAVTANELADLAADSAERARNSASEAFEAAEGAKGDAKKAKDAADEALSSADTAQVALSEVEKVVNVLEWVRDHGVYQLTNDTTVVDGRFYFTITGTAVASPTGNPKSQGWYEYDSTRGYFLTTDVEVDPEKTYYTITAIATIPSTKNPKEEGLYEIKSVDEAITNYVSTRLVLDEDGLKITNNNGYYILLSDSGMKIFKQGNADPLAVYGEKSVIGPQNGYHIEIGRNEQGVNEIGFYHGSGEAFKVAYIRGDQLYIPKVVVVTSMQVGDDSNGGAWRWSVDKNFNMGLYFLGSGGE